MKITAFVAALALSTSMAFAQSAPTVGGAPVGVQAGGVADEHDDDDDDLLGFVPLFGAAIFAGALLAFGHGGSSGSTTSTTLEEE